MSVDSNSHGHSQWFYFSCTNVSKDVNIKFNFKNFTKAGSTVKMGMRPIYKSKLERNDWRRIKN